MRRFKREEQKTDVWSDKKDTTFGEKITDLKNLKLWNQNKLLNFYVKVSLFGSAQSILSTPGLPLNSYPSPRTGKLQQQWNKTHAKIGVHLNIRELG